MPAPHVMTDSAACLRLLFPAPLNLGPGKVRLLEAIHASGSIAGGARQLKISYRRAWLMVDALNRAFPAVLVDTAAGGIKGGGARLSPLGEQVLARYGAMHAKAAAAIRGELEGFLTDLAGTAGIVNPSRSDCHDLGSS
jgi:molybdate transport system regulatory protein